MGQLPLLPGTAGRARRAARPRQAAEHDPVARVVLMTAVPHLDRPFDYEVPEALSQAAQPGTRVRVRLAGRLVDGFVLERVASSEHPLQPVASVHGPPVLTAELARLCRAVADRYAGTLADVLRFAVPPRHARVESRPEAPREPGAVPQRPDPAGWARYSGGATLLDRVGSARPARALWVAGPGEEAGRRIAELAAATRARGRGVLVVVPDAGDVRRATSALERAGVACVALEAEAGPQRRYRAFLDVLAGRAGTVVGTRGAVFAPVVDLGLVVVWDDGDESLAEPQAPGWHAREVAALRSAEQGVSLVLAGPAVSLEAARMAQSGWLVPVTLPRPLLRATMPRVQAAADAAHSDPAGAAGHIPAVALEVLRAGVRLGPVLASVPRTGYLPVLACQGCREPARCPQCAAALRAEGPDRRPTCPQHGPVGWACPWCADRRVRAVVVGVRRTAEEFGRALPGVPVLASSGDAPLPAVPERPCLVVATPGAEPVPGPGGYAALVLLDAAAALSRPGLRVAEEVLRRWLSCAAMVRPAAQGGRVLVTGSPEAREVQALVRWDPLGYAVRELGERRELGLPPAVRVAQLVGPAGEAGELSERLAAELGGRLVRRSGPLAGREDTATWLLAVSLADGPLLSAAVRRAQAARSARRAPVVTVRMDPVRLA